MAELQPIILVRNFVRHIEMCTSIAVWDLAPHSIYNYAQINAKKSIFLINFWATTN